MDMLSNPSGATVELIECFHFAPPGCHGCTIVLPPGCRRLFPASKFSDRNRYSGRPSTVIIYVNGVKASQSLTPEQFKRFVKLSFHVDDNGKLTIKGVESRFSDRFWIFSSEFDTVYFNLEKQVAAHMAKQREMKHYKPMIALGMFGPKLQRTTRGNCYLTSFNNSQLFS